MKTLIFLLTAIILFTGCKKDKDLQLPQATHTGANSFGCKINGEVFSVSGKSYLGHADGLTLYVSSNYASLIQATLDNKILLLQFDFKTERIVPGSYQMGRYEPYRGHYFYYPDGTVPTGSTEYLTDETHKGTVTLTDFNADFASGSFAFDAVNGEGQEVHVTEGRFDISFN